MAFLVTVPNCRWITLGELQVSKELKNDNQNNKNVLFKTIKFNKKNCWPSNQLINLEIISRKNKSGSRKSESSFS